MARPKRSSRSRSGASLSRLFPGRLGEGCDHRRGQRLPALSRNWQLPGLGALGSSSLSKVESFTFATSTREPIRNGTSVCRPLVD
jgi:hypothetical protein